MNHVPKAPHMQAEIKAEPKSGHKAPAAEHGSKHHEAGPERKAKVGAAMNGSPVDHGVAHGKHLSKAVGELHAQHPIKHHDHGPHHGHQHHVRHEPGKY